MNAPTAPAVAGAQARAEQTVPAPRTRPTPAWTPPDYLALALSRLRAAQPVEAVTFTAACPSCGEECEWTNEREDTRLLVSVTCGCTRGPR